MNFQVVSLHNKPIDEVSYIIWSESWSDYLVIDPYDYERISSWQEKNDKQCAYILLTHEHYDHIGAVDELRRQEGCLVVASESCSVGAGDPKQNLSAFYDALMDLHGVMDWEPINVRYAMKSAEVAFQGTYSFMFHEIKVSMIETPGHSPGSVCIEFADMVFTGDTLLRDVPVITRCPYGNKRVYKQEALPYLQSIPKDKFIYPGHGEPFIMKDSKYI